MLSLVQRLRLPALAVCLALLVTALVGRVPEALAQDGGHGPGAAHPRRAPHDAAHKEPSALDHVMDSYEFHVFDTLWPQHIHLPVIPLPFPEPFHEFRISKFMVLEVIAALLVIAVYVPLARRLKSGEPPRGPVANAFEVLLTFVRDEIAKPNLGPGADRYVPFLWTLFLFILFNNLLGMLPFLGSATASVYVTGGLALIVFFAIHGSAILAMGSAPAHGHDEHGHDDHAHGHDHAHGGHGHAHAPHAAEAGGTLQVVSQGTVRYAQSLWPHIDVPFPLGYIIKPLVFVIEVIGLLVRNAVLAVRLFANMFAGHMVLATILLFIRIAANSHPVLWGTITLSSVLGIVALSLLELFVAFLQAYIFTFLTSLFMGMAIHPPH